MTNEELKQWESFYIRYKNVEGNKRPLEKNDWTNFVRLNHLVMEATHDIHNKNMLGDMPTEVV